MMHRFVVVVPTSSDTSRADAAIKQLTPRLAGWRRVLQTSLATAWAFSAPPSRLGGDPRGAGGCLIGIDFSQADQSPSPSRQGWNSGHTPDASAWGAYVSIDVDPNRQTVEIYRDPTGRIACWRLQLAGVDVLFSHYEDVVSLRAEPVHINWDYIQYHLNNDWIRGDETGLADVTELLPGEEILYSSGRPRKLIRWRPAAIAANRFGDIEEAKRHIRATAEQAVIAWANRYENIALDLSGGLDSAIVLGLLRKTAGHQSVVGVNYVIAHAEGDERSFARDAAQLHGIDLIEQDILPEDCGPGASFAFRLLRPAIRSVPLGYDEHSTRLIKRLSADAFFTGSGGDHLFFDHLGVNATNDYLAHNRSVAGLFRTAHLLAQISKDTIWNALGSTLSHTIGRTSSLRELVQHENPFLSTEARDGADYSRFVHPWVGELVTTPPAKAFQILNIAELQQHYWRYGRADAAEEVHPFFSQPLVEACLRTPAYWFAAGGIQRGLARSIFADLLPESIRSRRTKSANTSHWVQILQRDLVQLRELLLGGRLAARGLLDMKRLEAVLTPMGLATNTKLFALLTCLTTETWIRQVEADHQLLASSRQSAFS